MFQFSCIVDKLSKIYTVASSFTSSVGLFDGFLGREGGLFQPGMRPVQRDFCQEAGSGTAPFETCPK